MSDPERLHWKRYKGTLAGFHRQEYFIRRGLRNTTLMLAVLALATAANAAVMLLHLLAH